MKKRAGVFSTMLPALVNANRELITRFEKKILSTLARVWGEEEAQR
ncbi:MAG: hypothetical protein HY888_08990 [Deltaproteobacteria bacterium]|nr:hypothetical protein [Deltaproteobacteria bacterium]